MFFLVVHGVVPDETSTILKITQDSTTTEVIEQALIKGNKASEKVYDYVLMEEVAPTWDKKRLAKRETSTNKSVQRILEPDEKPLQSQSRWTGDGKFILKKVSDDPSTRAWMSTIKAATMRKEKMIRASQQQLLDSSGETTITTTNESSSRESEYSFSPWNDDLIDNFLVCVYNVSPDQPYTILKATTTSTAQEIIQRVRAGLLLQA
jgi:phosphatidylinositol phospholipase C epsilon